MEEGRATFKQWRAGQGVRALIIVLLVLALPAEALAHGGRLDRHGCHNDRRTGTYHCHRGAPAASDRTRASRSSLAPVAAARSGVAGSAAFANCAAARAAGAAPVRRGDPGYGPHLDRDNDGIGCEPYRGRR